jgi:iron-sulfur cluster assembly protein
MTLDESKNESDIMDEGFGVTILTEDKLQEYLEGAVVDYVESRYGGGFEIKTNNPGGGCDSGCSSCGS